MYHNPLPLSDRCRGRWRDVLLQLGAIDAKIIDGRHHPCPWCGGKDRWRFTDHNGTGAFICNQCGRGDGVEIVKRSLCLDFKEAARRIEQIIGGAKIETKPVRSDEDQRRAMNALWGRSMPIALDDPADRYLASRLGRRGDGWPAALRSIDRCAYWSEGSSESFWPGMLAKVIAPDGIKACQISRLFLTPAGAKAPVLKPRKLMHGALPKGSAVRLGPVGDDGVLGVAEGVESAMASSIIHDVPVWACLTAGNLADFEPPDRANKIIIFGDNDASFTGQEAAYRLARRLTTKGLDTAVEIPERAKDWADVLIGEAHVSQ
jgi:putative DNA primase/helicase